MSDSGGTGAEADARRGVAGILGIGGLFVLIHLGGLLFVKPIIGTDPAPGADPGNPVIGLGFVVALLVVTALMLAAFRWGLAWIVRGAIVLVSFAMTWIVLETLLPPTPTISGVSIVPPLLALGLVSLLAIHPEWYVLNVTGVLVGVGVVGLLGMMIGVRAAIVLLALLAVYDFISVYKTKHMLTLAEGAIRGRLPVMLVVPLTWPFSLQDVGDEEGPPGPHGAMVIGLGDAVIPGMLATSAAVHGPVTPSIVAGIPLSGPVVGVLIGTLIGLVALFTIPARGEAHPGLPFLSSGAVAGYFLGAVVVGVDPLAAIEIG